MASTLLGWLTIELYDELFPTAAYHFSAMCGGSERVLERALSVVDGNTVHEMSYRNSKFFRVIPGFMAQAGDVLFNNGTGSITIGGGVHFSERGVCSEAMGVLSHDRRGLLCTATLGSVDSCNTQFYITLGPCPWQDGRDVVIGSVVGGYHILASIERLGTASGTLLRDELITITNCGNLPNTARNLESEPGVSRKLLPLRDVVRRFIQTKNGETPSSAAESARIKMHRLNTSVINANDTLMHSTYAPSPAHRGRYPGVAGNTAPLPARNITFEHPMKYGNSALEPKCQGEMDYLLAFPTKGSQSSEPSSEDFYSDSENTEPRRLPQPPPPKTLTYLLSNVKASFDLPFKSHSTLSQAHTAPDHKPSADAATNFVPKSSFDVGLKKRKFLKYWQRRGAGERPQ